MTATSRHVSLGQTGFEWRAWRRSALPLTVVVALLCLGAANVISRATWREVEDGVLWVSRTQGVTAAEVSADSPAQRAGIRPGDLLLAIDERAIGNPADVVSLLHASRNGDKLRYAVLRFGSREVIDLGVAPVPHGIGALYFVLAAVGIFTLLVGTAVRLRRPHDQATLHFFWLCVAFFGVFTFSFSGRLDRLDWVFYWADAVSILLLPPLFVHFALVFPDRPRTWLSSARGGVLLALLYVPAAVLGLARGMAITTGGARPRLFTSIIEALDRVEPLYLSLYLVAGLVVLLAARRRFRSVTARRQLRWIAWGTALGAGPFAFGYAVPFTIGVAPSLPMQLLAVPLSFIPLAFASAIVRYRLMDIEVIVKRTLVYVAALGAVLAIYGVLLKVAPPMLLRTGGERNWVLALLATLIAVLLAPPVKEWIQNSLDRAFYRDRYDYRRALVGFARDLNSDLDIGRLAERLVTRVMETLPLDGMALMLADETTPRFGVLQASGFASAPVPPLDRDSGIGVRVDKGHIVALDDPLAVSRIPVEEIDFWRDHGLYYFVPCVSKTGTIAVLALGRKDGGEGLNSEDMGLLAAVAGQIATALENGRLYRQLHSKAAELDRLRAFNENIVESLDEGLLVLDANDRIVRWNRALEQVYGVSRDRAIGASFADMFDAFFVNAVQSALRESPRGATVYRLPLRGRGTRADTAMLVNAAMAPLQGAGCDPCPDGGTIVIVEDISARVQLEEQLQISDKMASIGLLAAGVAHEINTPLTGISSFTQMLLENADPDDPTTHVLEKIERQTFRAAKIVNGLLNLSRPAAPAAPERAPVDVNAVIGDVLSLVEHQLEIGRVKVRRELSPTALVVSGAEHKLQQVFLNLFLNARDAMSKGGWLTVVSRAEGDRAIIEVADTGFGIPSEYLSRIYDPFFTTKTIGQGTGLGLSISYGIVREHDGSINCDSSVGQGTRFTVTLPLTQVGTVRPARLAQ